MRRKIVWPSLIALMLVSSTLPSFALPWSWNSYTDMPDDMDLWVDQIDIHGRKGVMIYDATQLYTTEDGGSTWGPMFPEPEGIVLPVRGGDLNIQACVRRADRVLYGGIGFVAVYNIDTGERQIETFQEDAGGKGIESIIDLLRNNVSKDWGIRAVDIRKGQYQNQMLAAGWTEVDDNDYRALLLASNDHGETWAEFPLREDWPNLRGVILQNMSYIVGPDNFLGENNLMDSQTQWVHIKYPNFETVDITGWFGRRNLVWFGRTDGTIMRREGDGDWEVFEVDPDIEDMEIAFRTDDDGVVVGNDRFGNGYVYHTTDGGETWEADSAPIPGWLTGCVEPSDNDSVKYQAVVYTRPDGDLNIVTHMFDSPGIHVAPLGVTLQRYDASSSNLPTLPREKKGPIR